MVKESLAPGVKNGHKADPAFKSPLRIFCKRLERLIDRAEKDIQGNSFVTKNHRIELMGKGEEIVKISTR